MCSNPRRLTAALASYKPIALGESCVRGAEWNLVIHEAADNGVPELSCPPEALGAVQDINLAKHGDCLRGRFYGDRMPPGPLSLLVKCLSYTYATSSYVRGLSRGVDTWINPYRTANSGTSRLTKRLSGMGFGLLPGSFRCHTGSGHFRGSCYRQAGWDTPGTSSSREGRHSAENSVPDH
jgi:hypothetical protein